MKLHPNIPASILIFIIESFIVIKANAKQLQQMLSLKYNKIPCYMTILKILQNIRYVLADYMKDKYRRYQIGGPPEKKKIVAIDECLMTHDHGQQQWIVGAVETDTYKKRFDIIPVRNQSNLEIFVKNHIEPGTIIVSDGWSGYRFLDNADTSVWEHKKI